MVGRRAAAAIGRPTGRLPDSGLFLREFLRAPLRTAAVLPSSAALARAMIGPIPATGHPVVVELGPGTGAFSGAIQDRLDGRGLHLAVELNPALAARLTARHPRIRVVTAHAAHLPAVLAEHGIDHADVVVSGLPWAAYTPLAGGRTLPATIASVLHPHGAFTQFGYRWTRRAAPARRLSAHLHAAFHQVVVGPTVWPNVPPAFVHTARRPR